MQAMSVHDSLAVRICNEILRDVSAPEVRLYCKTLSWLEINTEPGPANSELQLLLKDILQVRLELGLFCEYANDRLSRNG